MWKHNYHEKNGLSNQGNSRGLWLCIQYHFCFWSRRYTIEYSDPLQYDCPTRRPFRNMTAGPRHTGQRDTCSPTDRKWSYCESGGRSVRSCQNLLKLWKKNFFQWKNIEITFSKCFLHLNLSWSSLQTQHFFWSFLKLGRSVSLAVVLWGFFEKALFKIFITSILMLTDAPHSP